MSAEPQVAGPPSAEPRLRDRLPLAPRSESDFRWRGLEVSRMEGFTDAVFGFAVTLLVVALEVPTSFSGLLDVVRGLPAFVICFTLLMLFWNAHYRFHRRYGLDDALSRVITMAILVLVLFLVYPLKFLFTLLTVRIFDLEMANPPVLEASWQVQWLYVIYGLSFAGAWGFYAILYAHAWRRRSELALDAIERLYTREAMMEYLVHVSVCVMSIVLALTTANNWLPGTIYFLVGPLQALNGWYFGRQIRRLRKVPA
jgi:uncharacterized membrane protein